jgi:hypothetical protein
MKAFQRCVCTALLEEESKAPGLAAPLHSVRWMVFITFTHGGLATLFHASFRTLRLNWIHKRKKCLCQSRLLLTRTLVRSNDRVLLVSSSCWSSTPALLNSHYFHAPESSVLTKTNKRMKDFPTTNPMCGKQWVCGIDTSSLDTVSP